MSGSDVPVLCIQDNVNATAEFEKRNDEELDRQVLLAEQRREEERLQQERRQREKMEKLKAVEGMMIGTHHGRNYGIPIFNVKRFPEKLMYFWNLRNESSF